MLTCVSTSMDLADIFCYVSARGAEVPGHVSLWMALFVFNTDNLGVESDVLDQVKMLCIGLNVIKDFMLPWAGKFSATEDGHGKSEN
ncbi:hypothetical protein QYF36_024226 [Acer negundo]|nr:hypothetical protein QYF36_024226 [Acer negundo]